MSAPSVVFDPDGELFEVDWLTFAALVGTGADVVPDHEAKIQALREAGALDDRDQLHPVLQPLVAAISDPIIHVEVTVGGVYGVHAHHLWADDAVAVALAVHGDDRYRILSSAPSEVPTSIARLARLGPRGRCGVEAFSTDRSDLGLLFADDEPGRRRGASAVRSASPQSWGPEWAQEWSGSAWRAVQCLVRWGEAEAPHTTREAGLSYLDTPAGVATVAADDDDGVVIAPSSPSEVWVAFIDLLPIDVAIPSRCGA